MPANMKIIRPNRICFMDVCFYSSNNENMGARTDVVALVHFLLFNHIVLDCLSGVGFLISIEVRDGLIGPILVLGFAERIGIRPERMINGF